MGLWVCVHSFLISLLDSSVESNDMKPDFEWVGIRRIQYTTQTVFVDKP